MIEESRIVKLESDVHHLQATDDLLRSQFEALRSSITSLHILARQWKLWIFVLGAGAILSVWTATFALARYLKP